MKQASCLVSLIGPLSGLASLTVTPLPITVSHATTCVRVLQYLSVVLGRRSYRNVMRLLADATHPSRFDRPPLITTDGYRYYRIVLGRLLDRGCIHGRVVKTYRKNRVTKVERDLSIGSDWQLKEALRHSEDSDRLNTSFVERLNLTIRQGSAYLQRRSPAHARFGQYLAGHLELRRKHLMLL